VVGPGKGKEGKKVEGRGTGEEWVGLGRTGRCCAFLQKNLSIGPGY